MKINKYANQRLLEYGKFLNLKKNFFLFVIKNIDKFAIKNYKKGFRIDFIK